MAARPARLRARGGGPHRPRGRCGDGLALKHVAEILTNPFYAGRLWSGEPSALGAARRPSRPGSTSRRCGRGTAAGTGGRSTAASTAWAGSWPALPAAAGSSGTSGGTATSTPARRSGRPPRAGSSATARRSTPGSGASRTRSTCTRRRSAGPSSTLPFVDAQDHTVRSRRRPEPEAATCWRRPASSRERERAALRFAKDRDLGRLEATMARLDAEAAAAVVRPSRIPTAAEARAYLESLPELWAKTSDAGRTRSPRPCSSGSTCWG